MPRAAAVLLIATIALSSCTDPEAIAKFARASHDAGVSFHAIAAQGQPSCERATSFVLTGQDKPDCEIYTRIEEPVLAINDAYFGYLAALGSLAAEDTSKTAAGFAGLQTSLKAADPHLSSDELARAGAAGTLISAIARLATSHYRARELRRIMREADGGLQQTASFLSVYASGKYEQGLRDERTRERAFCFDEIRRNGEHEPLAALLVSRQCDVDRAATERALAGVAAYRKAVILAAATHRKLMAADAKWDSGMLQRLLPDLQQLADAADAARTAF